MRFIRSFFGWVFGVLFLLFGLGAFATSFKAGLPLLAISLLILPPVRKAVYSRTNKKLPTLARLITVFLLLVTSTIFTVQAQSRSQRLVNQQASRAQAEARAVAEKQDLNFFQTHRDEIVADCRDSLITGNYQFIVSQSTKYGKYGDEELGRIAASARASLREIKKEQKTKALLAELKTVPAIQYEKNLELYTELAQMHPDNALYTQKINTYSVNLREARTERKAKQRAQAAQRNRQANIEKQFSSWNGAHRNLEAFIKQNMNDPDSFKHVQTKYWDKDDYLVVQMSFRGKNGFGATVLNSITAKVSLSGQVLEILSQE